MFASLVLALALTVSVADSEAVIVEHAATAATNRVGSVWIGGFVLTPRHNRVSLAPGSQGFEVIHLQQKLADVGVYRGDIDGDFGPQTETAVVAAHKLLGAERGATWLAEDWDRIDSLDHTAILARNAGEADRVEVDLERQLMFVIRDADVAAIIPVSTGNGERYWSKNAGSGGGYVKATTPRGDFSLFKHVAGWRKNYLGSLYKPWYFTPYYAVHGSRRVPVQPASHGCVRVPTWESDHLDDYLDIGLPVHIWDA